MVWKSLVLLLTKNIKNGVAHIHVYISCKHIYTVERPCIDSWQSTRLQSATTTKTKHSSQGVGQAPWESGKDLAELSPTWIEEIERPSTSNDVNHQWMSTHEHRMEVASRQPYPSLSLSCFISCNSIWLSAFVYTLMITLGWSRGTPIRTLPSPFQVAVTNTVPIQVFSDWDQDQWKSSLIIWSCSRKELVT